MNRPSEEDFRRWERERDSLNAEWEDEHLREVWLRCYCAALGAANPSVSLRCVAGTADDMLDIYLERCKRGFSPQDEPQQKIMDPHENPRPQSER